MRSVVDRPLALALPLPVQLRAMRVAQLAQPRSAHEALLQCQPSITATAPPASPFSSNSIMRAVRVAESRGGVTSRTAAATSLGLSNGAAAFAASTRTCQGTSGFL